jgi:8-oxo-dGTP pyrophosphatase MutT (NUDIX family)
VGYSVYEILLTKRSEKVETHKGQISFPGGLFETQDEHLLKTALREAKEEVGLKEAQIEILGALSPVQTLRDVEIYPWVAEVQFPREVVFNPDEVERLLFLPVELLLMEGLKPVQVSVTEGGLNFKVASIGIFCEQELIWGASAKILELLLLNLK